MYTQNTRELIICIHSHTKNNYAIKFIHVFLVCECVYTQNTRKKLYAYIPILKNNYAIKFIHVFLVWECMHICMYTQNIREQIMCII